MMLAKNIVKDAFTGSDNAEKLEQTKKNQEKIKEEAKKHGFLPDVDFSF